EPPIFFTYLLDNDVRVFWLLSEYTHQRLSDVFNQLSLLRSRCASCDLNIYIWHVVYRRMDADELRPSTLELSGGPYGPSARTTCYAAPDLYHCQTSPSVG